MALNIRSEPGVWLSAAAHLALIGAALFSLSATPLPSADEGIPVEIFTDAQVSEITRGERNAAEVRPETQPRVERLAERREERDPGQAERDAPAPPTRPPELRVTDEEPAPPPPDTRREEAARAAEAAREREAARARADAQARAEAQAARARADAEAREAKLKVEADAKARADQARAEQARADAQARAEAKARAEARAEAQARAEAEERAEAEAEAKAKAEKVAAEKAAEAKARAEAAAAKAREEAAAKARAEAEARAEAQARAEAEAKQAEAKQAEADAKAVAEAKARADAEAKRQAEAKLRAETKAKAEAEAKAKRQAELADRFNPSELQRMLASREPTQGAGSTGAQVNRTASLGTATGQSQRLNPSMRDSLAGIISEQLYRCWLVPVAVQSAQRPPVPVVRIQLNQDGSLAAEPALANRSAEPLFDVAAESALRAAKRCSPLKIPAQFAPYYADWKNMNVNFHPHDRG